MINTIAGHFGTWTLGLTMFSLVGQLQLGTQSSPFSHKSKWSTYSNFYAYHSANVQPRHTLVLPQQQLFVTVRGTKVTIFNVTQY